MIKPILTIWLTLEIWATLNLVSVGVLWWNVRERNRNLPSVMNFV